MNLRRLRRHSNKSRNPNAQNGFWCKKYGFVTKSVQKFTIRKVNQSNHQENGTQR
jgi:hypothetical protein